MGIGVSFMYFVSSFKEAKDFVFLVSPLLFTAEVAGLLVVATIVPSVARFVSESPLSALSSKGIITKKAFFYLTIGLAIGSLFALLYLIFETALRAGVITVILLVGILILLFVLRGIFRWMFRRSQSLRMGTFFRFDGFRSLVRPNMPASVVTLTLTTALVSVFVFLAISLTFQDRLVLSVADDTNIYAMNILESDRAKVVQAFPKDELFSIIRARISSVNDKPLEQHTGEKDPSSDLTREFSITTNPLDDVRILR